MSFWDSSALVSLCTKEPRSTIAGRFWRRFPDRAISWTTPVEIASALARLQRENRISEAQRLIAESRLVRLESNIFVIEPLQRIIDLARTLPLKYGLRAGDSIQLASALVWCKEIPKNKDFVCGDQRLLSAAEDTGFTAHDLS